MSQRPVKSRTSARSRAAGPRPANGDGAAPTDPFVVGVGASAGGLQALQSFFGAIKEPPNAAFVVVQHLSPDFKSFMVELLGRHTSMKVQRAEHDARVKPGNIYLIPPKVTLTIAKGRLRLQKLEANRGLHLPIDQFLFSLALDQKHHGVAIILSGTGSDGTAGIRAVKEAGGMVMVQSEDSAQFDGMPRSAIGTGLADFVLPPDKMPAQLAKYLNHPLLTRTRSVGRRRGGDLDSLLGDVFGLIRTQCAVDFTHYKPATIDRRLERRMSVCQIETLSDYARHLAQSPREIGLLFNELLINVTSFFRDRAAWDMIEKDVLPALLKALPANEPFRAWVAGCSTGEEAYSLAILIDEAMQKLKRRNPVKIFATDISKDSLVAAARGQYSPTDVAGVPPARLQQYFVKESSGYRVKARLREMVVFANHNLLSDPPFTKLSLICCRNLLIYLQSAMQQRVLNLFSFGLLDDGVLFLGSSESIGDATDRFAAIATRANLYRNRRVGAPPPMLGSAPRIARVHAESTAAIQRANASMIAGEIPSMEDIHRRILAEFAPACMVVDARDDVVHIIGSAADYLKLSPGGFSRNLFKLTSHNLANALRSALIRAQQKGDRFTYDNVRFKDRRKTHAVRIHVRPMPDKHGKPSGTRLVYIERQAAPPAAGKTTRRYRHDAQTAHRITDLERDLSLTRDTLQATVQDLETSNEEIQAANEELLAANEELQSTNEELQSLNEELHTVNTENQSRIEELTRLTNDINNLLAVANVGVLLVDAQLRIRRASRSALLVLDLTEADLGVPIETVARILHVSDLGAMAERVMRSGQLEERAIEGPGASRWLLLRCVPFRNEVGRAQGVVVIFVDLTEQHVTEQRVLSQAAVTQGVLDAMRANIVILNRQGRVVHKNWGEFGGDATGSELPNARMGEDYFDACAQPDAGTIAADALEAMRQVLRGELPHRLHDYATDGSDGKRWFRLHIVPVHSPEAGLAIAHFEITPTREHTAPAAHGSS
ncbi:MAG TPA: chemotaxis protein CheB [Opitutaceae bacterium]|nr:chemotaxis protein CheB [Opitutaceae bacterium]